jgi:hypothetical protein
MHPVPAERHDDQVVLAHPGQQDPQLFEHVVAERHQLGPIGPVVHASVTFFSGKPALTHAARSAAHVVLAELQVLQIRVVIDGDQQRVTLRRMVRRAEPPRR